MYSYMCDAHTCGTGTLQNVLAILGCLPAELGGAFALVSEQSVSAGLSKILESGDEDSMGMQVWETKALLPAMRPYP